MQVTFIDHKEVSSIKFTCCDCILIMLHLVWNIVEAHCGVISERKSFLSNSRNIDEIQYTRTFQPVGLCQLLFLSWRRPIRNIETSWCIVFHLCCVNCSKNFFVYLVCEHGSQPLVCLFIVSPHFATLCVQNPFWSTYQCGRRSTFTTGCHNSTN